MPEDFECLTVIKTQIGIKLLDRDGTVFPVEVIKELRKTIGLLEDEIKTIQGQLIDSM